MCVACKPRETEREGKKYERNGRTGEVGDERTDRMREERAKGYGYQVSEEKRRNADVYFTCHLYFDTTGVRSPFKPNLRSISRANTLKQIQVFQLICVCCWGKEMRGEKEMNKEKLFLRFVVGLSFFFWNLLGCIIGW